MGVISTKPISKYGFLRFHSTTSFTVSGGNVTSPITYSENDDLPTNNYLVRNQIKSKYNNPIKSSATSSVTLCTTLETGTFGSDTVIIVDVSTGLAVTGATVTAVRYNTNKSIIVTVTYNNANSKRQIDAILVVGNGAHVSNQFALLPQDNIYTFPTLYYQDVTDWYDFNYTETVTIGSYTGKPFNQLYVNMNLISVEYPNDSTQYRNVTDSRIRIIKQVIDQEMTLETYYFDFYAHQAMAVALNHSTLRINGKDYILSSGGSYEPNTNKGINISVGSATLVDRDFTEKNKPCPTISES